MLDAVTLTHCWGHTGGPRGPARAVPVQKVRPVLPGTVPLTVAPIIAVAAMANPRLTLNGPDAYGQRARSRLSPQPRCRIMTTRPGNRLARPRHWLLPGTDRGALRLSGTDDACARIEPCLLSAHRLLTGRMPVKLAR